MLLLSRFSTWSLQLTFNSFASLTTNLAGQANPYLFYQRQKICDKGAERAKMNTVCGLTHNNFLLTSQWVLLGNIGMGFAGNIG